MSEALDELRKRYVEKSSGKNYTKKMYAKDFTEIERAILHIASFESYIQASAMCDELAEMREALKKKNIILAMYANPDNWKSINGVMVLQTLCPPWADAKMVLED